MNLQSKAFTCGPVIDHLEELTEQQKIFWQKLFGDDSSATSIQRTDFDPISFQTFLPNIWMGDLIIDQDGTLRDVKVRLEGTRLVKVFGERTNQNIITDDSNDRFLIIVNKMYEIKAPIYTWSDYVDKDKEHLNSTSIVVPMCKGGNVVNMAIGYTEFMYKTSKSSIIF